MDEYSATDHSVILTQQGRGGKDAKTNRAAAAHTHKVSMSTSLELVFHVM